MNIGKGDSLKNANEIKGNPIKYNVEINNVKGDPSK